VTDRRPPFKYSALARVWFSDTDAQGVVYYGRYLPYFDHARTEYHRHLGPIELGEVEPSCARRTWNTARKRSIDLIAFTRISRARRRWCGPTVCRRDASGDHTRRSFTDA
jgi:hypothetical protein